MVIAGLDPAIQRNVTGPPVPRGSSPAMTREGKPRPNRRVVNLVTIRCDHAMASGDPRRAPCAL